VRAPDYAAENRALVALARTMADAPETILQRLVETALELCDAHTAGISLLEEQDGRQVFGWHAIAGMYAEHRMGMAPRDFSPCGVVVDRAAPELLAYPGRRFPYRNVRFKQKDNDYVRRGDENVDSHQPP
jgi:hypothetical protein